MISFENMFYQQSPSDIALETKDEAMSYALLQEKVAKVANWLDSEKVHSVALLAQNSIDWVIIDLACQSLNIVLTPIPLFFSAEQVEGLMASIHADLILTDRELTYDLTLKWDAVNLKGCRLSQQQSMSAPKGTSKVTFTSGSTGTPKGVCLSVSNQLIVAQSLVGAIGLEKPRHLCLLPLPTLLENIAGIYAPLFAKGTIILTSDKERGFEGSKLVDPQQFLTCISQYKPNTLILVPELLHMLIIAAKNGWKPPTSLKFIAVGGSRVSPTSILQARSLGLPVCQGYGLSECGSVVSLCSLDDDVNSAGKILPHAIASTIDNELIVAGNTFLGYLETPSSWGEKAVHTGDIASIEGGNLMLHGRIKNTIINSYGRNICPEWIESELLATGLFIQALVIGDARPFCSALLVPSHSSISPEMISNQLSKLNQTLPDYAQIFHPILLSEPMSTADNLYTPNMRPRRDIIQQHFEHEIEHVYSQQITLEA